jgi:hypothetical protein
MVPVNLGLRGSITGLAWDSVVANSHIVEDAIRCRKNRAGAVALRQILRCSELLERAGRAFGPSVPASERRYCQPRRVDKFVE